MMMSRRIFKRAVLVFAILILGLAIWGGIYVNSLLPIATGYSAKQLSSAIFITKRSQAEFEKSELSFFPVSYVKNAVNMADSTVTSKLLWGSSTVKFRKSTGSTLVRGSVTKVNFLNHEDTLVKDQAWPMGNVLPAASHAKNNAKLAAIADKLILDRAYGGTCHAFLVMKKGIPVMERYAAGFDSSTKFLSWSMAKSFTNAIVGTIVKGKNADIYKPIGFKEWQGDARRAITVNHLLRMVSGLQWNENYGNLSDVTQMLYKSGSASKYAMSKPLEYPAGSHWEYSSGSTNIVCEWARRKFSGNEEFYTYIYSHLFNRIGMNDIVLEPDASGLFVGSSYAYCTARDYARFALLYLQDGVFNGTQLLPKGWVQYSVRPTKGCKNTYGAGFWLNINGKLPADMYRCDGHDGQRVFIIPSHQMAIVVLGYSPKPNHVMDFDRLVGDVLQVAGKQ